MNQVLLGDCLELMKDIPDKSIDAIITDLPYGMTACKWDVIIPFEPLWEQYERIIKDNGAIVLTASQPFSSMLVMSNHKMFKYEWIWKKNRCTGYLTANKKPMKNHEVCLVFYKKTPTYNPIKTAGEPYNRSHKKQNRAEIYADHGAKNTTNTTGDRFPNSCFYIKAEYKSIHPTQKPVELFEYFILTYTNEGETVLDNCAGSGTTAIAAINTKRNYICMEKEEKYYDMMIKRIEEHEKQSKIKKKLF